jgi:hypothetical protein
MKNTTGARRGDRNITDRTCAEAANGDTEYSDEIGMRKPRALPVKPNPARVAHSAISRELNEIFTVFTNLPSDVFFRSSSNLAVGEGSKS